MKLRQPPRTETQDGSPRRIGVELEFAALSARDGARLVQSLYGGEIQEEDPHRFFIRDTAFGTFRSELDSQYAHRPSDTYESYVTANDPLTELMTDFQDGMRRIYGDISSLIVPCEIVCPPIAITDLAKLEALVVALSEAGAEGTRNNPFYAFGAQLNPEIATKDPQWLTAILKAYLLLSDWLRAVVEIDVTRRLVAFADPFPRAYTTRVVSPDYWPDQDALIRDYLTANPTRNRELDLLPLFAWMAPDQVRQQVSDARISPRPAFHYRLPDSNLGMPGWSLTLEWNRWCVVERLADQRETLNAMGVAYRQNSDQLLPADWAIKASEWLVLSE